MQGTRLLAAIVAFAAAPGAREWVAPEVDAPRVERRTFESKAAGTRVSYFIYTPPVYDSNAARRFPTIYWLHGGGGSRGKAMTAGVAPMARYFDAAIREGKLEPSLIVFPNGLDSLWVDSKDGGMPVETIVVKELLPEVDARFRTIGTREGRTIEGFSMGGYGAARLGFKYPDLFARVSILSGGPLQQEFTETPRAGPRQREYVLNNVFGGDHEYFQAQSPWVIAGKKTAEISGRCRIRLIIGDSDEMLAVYRRFETRLKELGIPHEYRELPGVGHRSQAVYSALGEAQFEFYRRSR